MVGKRSPGVLLRLDGRAALVLGGKNILDARETNLLNAPQPDRAAQGIEFDQVSDIELKAIGVPLARELV
jgi:hypothetical protein